jgi:hypothetical protein
MHSDKSINFHAKEKIRFTAENDLVLNSQKYLYSMGDSGILNSSQNGAVRHYARAGISSYTYGTQLHGAAGRIDLAGSQVHFNSVAPRTSWGPTWLKPSHKKIDLEPVKVTDIVAEQPISQRGVVNTQQTETTVTDYRQTKRRHQEAFVTHEPYTRPVGGRSEEQLTKEYVDTVMARIEKENPNLSTSELNEIRKKLESAKNVNGVIRMTKQIANEDPKVVLKETALNELNKIANQVKQDIKDALSEVADAAKDAAKEALGL